MYYILSRGRSEIDTFFWTVHPEPCVIGKFTMNIPHSLYMLCKPIDRYYQSFAGRNVCYVNEYTPVYVVLDE